VSSRGAQTLVAAINSENTKITVKVKVHGQMSPEYKQSCGGK